MRSATCAAATSGFVVVVLIVRFFFRHDPGQQRFDAAASFRGLVVLEVQLRRVAETDAPAEIMTDGAARLLERLDDLPRLFFLQPADEYAREVKIRTDVHAGDGCETELDVLEVAAE